MTRLSANTTELRVRLKEIACDHVYFGVVFTWFEVGRSEFCRAAGTPYADLERRGFGSFVTYADARYRRPIPPDSRVQLETTLAAMTRVRFSFVYALFGGGGTQPLVTGRSDHVMADASGRPRRVPHDFAAATMPTGELPEAERIDGPDAVAWAHSLRVRYEETDALRTVYYGNYFAWMEAAWTERLAGGPWDLARTDPQGRAFPVLSASCRYLAPARYDDLVHIHVGVTPVKRTRVRLDYRFSTVGASCSDGAILAHGRTVHAVTDGSRVVAVPDDLLEALGAPTLPTTPVSPIRPAGPRR